MPPRLKYALASAVGLTLLFFGVSLLLKTQLRKKTLALSEKNELLNQQIEERRHAESALKENEERLSNLMDNLPGMVYGRRLDDRGSFTFVSSGSRKLVGYEPGELLQKANSLKSLIHPEDFEKIYGKDVFRYTGQEAKKHYQSIYRINTRSRGYKWVCDYGVIMKPDGPDRHPIQEGFITDITQQQEEDLWLKRQNLQLKSVVKEGPGFGNIIGKSHLMQQVYEMILTAAASEEPVVVRGESGVGKELVSRAIHSLSGRGGKNFVPVNCGAIPENLMESELFGYKKGAFTGADSDKTGFMDRADGGSLFLDEIGAYPYRCRSSFSGPSKAEDTPPWQF